MTVLRNMTIRHKLTLVIMVTCTSALLSAGTGFIMWGQFAFRRTMVQNLSTQAEMIADNCKAALAFDDVEDAKETLKALQAQPSVVFSEIHTKDGKQFAGYFRDDADSHIPVGHQEDGYSFDGGLLTVCKNIVLEGEKIGSVLLQSDLGPLRAMLRRNTIIIFAVVVFAGLVAYFVSSRLQTIISRPILSLAEVAKTISGKKDYSTRVQQKSNDEIGMLINAFNEMLEQIHQHQAALIEANEQLEERVRQRTAELEDTHRKLVDASREAGMAQVATDVLHNVGNVLNSINVSTTLIHEKISKSEISNLKKVTDIVKAHTEDLATFLSEDPQGKHIPTYLSEVSKLLTEEQSDTIEKLRSLAKNVEHIKEIVKMQQSYAKASGVEVAISFTELVENSIQINGAGLKRHGIQLTRDFTDLGTISIDKQRVLQILVNLISNAKYAMEDNDGVEKLLTIRFYKHGADTVRVEVTDNGVGRPEENLTRIFNRGFTTKARGHGFGLHSAALAAKEIGGSLGAHSDGVGRGAMFTLEFPFKPAEHVKCETTDGKTDAS